LRISLEEEKARQEAEAAKASGATQETQPTSMDIDKAVGNDNQNDKTEDDMLAQALATGETRVCVMVINYIFLLLKSNYHLFFRKEMFKWKRLKMSKLLEQFRCQWKVNL
jgi:hypothetical protein